MRKSVLVLAVIGAACSSVAFATEVKKDKAHVPAVKGTTMSDADMEKVTAGAAVSEFVDGGVITKLTGSIENGHGNVGAILGGNGTANQNIHFKP
jgi:hypothetical protein